MKTKITWVLLLLLVSTVSFSQDFKKFKFGIGLAPASSFAKMSGGIGGFFYIEPSIRIKDNILLSYRIDFGVISRAYTSKSETGSLEVGDGLVSNAVFGQYYLGNKGFRPFVGVGLGLFNTLNSKTWPGTTSVPAESKIGFSPRLGFDAGHFNLFIDYNILPATSIIRTINPATGQSISETGTVNNSFIRLSIGASIGGGRLK